MQSYLFISLSVCLSVCLSITTEIQGWPKHTNNQEQKLLTDVKVPLLFKRKTFEFFCYYFSVLSSVFTRAKTILFLLAMICLLFYIVFFMLHFSFFFPMEVKLTSQFLVVTGGAAEGDSECSNCTRCDLILT